VRIDANAAHAGNAWPKAIAVGRRALAMLEDGQMPGPPVVGFSAGNPRTDVRAPPPGRASSRDLRDARALLTSIRSHPLLQNGRLPHETP
jgi:hypothetical protein